MFGLIPRKNEKRVEGYWPYEPPMEVLRREFAPIFERMFGHWPGFVSEGVPPYGPELEETPEAIIIREAVPGFDIKEIEVKICGPVLIVHAQRQVKEGEKVKVCGELERKIPLPEGVDIEHVEAIYRNGVLEVKFPKLPEAKERYIVVKT